MKTTETIQFKVGEEYVTRFACDADTKITTVVVARTDKTVMVTLNGVITKRKINNYYGVETFRTASYSMAPVFSADRMVTT